MHIAEGFLPPAQAAIWTAVAAPFVIHGAVSVVRRVRNDPDSRLLLGAAGAFTFVLSAIKLPSVTGSSSHPTGTGLGAVLFRPPIMAFIGSVVLLFQALLLAHGGITTLGANTVSMAIVGPWVGYGLWRIFRSIGAPMSVGIFFAMFGSNIATYCTTSLQLAIAFPDSASSFAGSLMKFLSVFAVTQIPLAVIEGILGIMIMQLLQRTAGPELLRLGIIKMRKKSNIEQTANVSTEISQESSHVA